MYNIRHCGNEILNNFAAFNADLILLESITDQ